MQTKIECPSCQQHIAFDVPIITIGRSKFILLLVMPLFLAAIAAAVLLNLAHTQHDFQARTMKLETGLSNQAFLVAAATSNCARLKQTSDRDFEYFSNIGIKSINLGSNLNRQNSENQRVWETRQLTNLFMFMELGSRIDALEAHFPGPRSGTPAATPARRTGPATMKNGVPADVYDAMAAHAAQMFPNSYDMQLYVINQELEAYKKLHP